MQIVLHLGAHKTGSTLLQSIFLRNRKLLLKKGIWYVTLDTINSSGIKSYLRKDISYRPDHPDKERVLKALLYNDIPAHCHTALISRENLFGETLGFYPNFENLSDCFAELMSDHEVRVLYFLRRQDQFLNSCYAEWFHIGEYISRDTFFHAMNMNVRGALSWKSKVDSLCSTYGEQAVNVGFFDYLENGVDHYLDYFMSMAGWQIRPNEFDLSKTQRAGNVRISKRTLAVITRTYPFIRERQKRANWARILRRLPYFNSGEKVELLSECQKNNLIRSYRTENNGLIEKYAAADSVLKANWLDDHPCSQ